MSSRSRERGEEADPLTIDLAAAAELVQPDEIRSWARDQRVFVSSVMDELRTERKAVADAVGGMGAQPIWFEGFGGRDADPTDAYTAEVATSTIYVGILGQRYGRPLPTRFSATHTEYLFAEERGLRICVYPLDVQDREGREQSFLEEVWQFHTAPVVSSSDLPAAVTRRCERIAAEDLSPWCKLGSLVFRATSIAESGDEIVIDARVRSNDVAHGLNQMAGDRWNRVDGQLTWSDRSQSVRVSDVQVTTTASSARTYRIFLHRREAQRDSMLEVSFNNRTPDDLTETAVRVGLLGERNPLDEQQMSFMADIGNPLEPLRRQRVPDEILRPIARLLVVESLVGTGRIARVTMFRLGTAVAGRRRVDLEWETPRRNSNVRPVRRRVDGLISLP